MRILKRVAIGFAVLVLLLVVIGWLLPSTFKVSRSVDIAAPAERIYPRIADPREWRQWSVWNRRDPQMQITYSGPPSGTGAKWEWKSKSQGDGAMTFTAAEPSRRLGYDLYFPDFGTTSSGDLTLAPAGTGTRVTWTMNGDMGKNPLFHWMALMADGMVGKDFEAGLAGLKEVAEKP